ncbi:acetate/propionate family kinase [Foetidibacter luteolus]|uniref:acetate/propionate family kinase n=1 Tax=Foetidibacter luteolus TaxID=2608880 RepID=UPI00129AA5A5|nr:acetate kinase [Foetidibacter luteolus]
MKILVINAGSSSLKFQLFNTPPEKPLCTGLAERIGNNDALLRCKIYSGNNEKTVEKQQGLANHGDALGLIIEILTDAENQLLKNKEEITVVGHRVVHGGEDFTTATIITPQVKEKIKHLFPLAPLHNPANYACIEVAEEHFPAAKQVAVFDTAFHQAMPPRAFRYALPSSYYTEHRIRVYGFHGTSHKYVTGIARDMLGNPDAKMISIHLGNGCSMAAVKGDKPLDTSMGFGPLSGLVMGTRSGDIDPSVIFHLRKVLKMTTDEVDNLLNRQSGMLGLCGYSDMRDVNKAAASGDASALFALEAYAYRIKKYIGAYAAVLNGVDTIIFTAGVGENDSDTRARVCRDMDWLGVSINDAANNQRVAGPREISPAGSPVKVMVVPTNEELEIARECAVRI